MLKTMMASIPTTSPIEAAMPLTAPFLRKISLLPEKIERDAFPFTTLPWLTDDFELAFEKPITILAGENGSGKSTLLEAIASLCGFSVFGGNHNHGLMRVGERDPLREALRPAWLPKVSRGFFLRAESFLHLADYIDREGDINAWGGKSLQARSHGESFLTSFRLKLAGRQQSIYILDEPEAALSPQRLNQFLKIMDDWQNSGRAQAIIATHSPIIMGMPGADLRVIGPDGIQPCRLQDVPHFRQLRSFFDDPESYYDEAISTPLPDLEPEGEEEED
jgi:predicted ATPase